MTALPIVGAYSWVPQFARGHVRDLRVRWALEEIGQPYRSETVDVRAKPATIAARQPFRQVPWYRDGDVEMFESGAILIWIALQSGELMGTGDLARARTLSWLFSAVNSIEPFTIQLAAIDLFNPDEEWARLRRPKVAADIAKRLAPIAARLDGRDFLTDDFTIADIAMTTVLRDIADKSIIAAQPALAAYVARNTARPAFERAMAAQLADFLPLDAPLPTSKEQLP